MVQTQIFCFNPFEENTVVVWEESSKAAVIIDPGCYEAYERRALQQFIEEKGLKPQYLLNTHCHVDHVLGNAFVSRTWGLTLYIHPLEEGQLRAVEAYAPVYGFTGYEKPESYQFLSQDQPLRWGDSQEWEIRFTPGHAPGHVVFYDRHFDAGRGLLIGGDVLFRESIGRTDLPGGNHQDLLQSIQNQLFVLPESTVVYPGHGPSTTIGHEKKNNPWLRA